MTHPYTQTLAHRFGGVIASGAHEPDGVACALEVASVARGVPWTDSPAAVGLPDLRPINDAQWSSDAMRTEHLTPVIVAYWDWAGWPEARCRAVLARVAEGTIRRVLPMMLRGVGLTAEAERCEREGSVSSARSARSAAESAAVLASARSARSAVLASAAALAARSARSSAALSARSAVLAAAAVLASAVTASAVTADQVLIMACDVWLEAAREV